ncbi:MAG TPA: hypothetical protein PKV84_00300 [Candidatus Omnitrophota bacterium]|nr:hypothetical protein [Candidatus Omnitrophota bacterium]
MVVEIEKLRGSALLYEEAVEWAHWVDRVFSSPGIDRILQATDFISKLLDVCPSELKTIKQIVLASIFEKGGSFVQRLSLISSEALVCWVELASSLKRYFDLGDEQERCKAKDLILKIRKIFNVPGFFEIHQSLKTGTQVEKQANTEEL